MSVSSSRGKCDYEMKTTPIKQGLSKILTKNAQPEELANVLIEKNLIGGEKIETNGKGFMDENTIFFIHPKNETIKAFIKNNFDVKETNTPKTNFTAGVLDIEKEIASNFSTAYLKAILKMCEGYEKVKIKMKRNYPICIETDDFECLLAPRVEPADEI
jgi:hypothetical protein